MEWIFICSIKLIVYNLRVPLKCGCAFLRFCDWLIWNDFIATVVVNAVIVALAAAATATASGGATTINGDDEDGAVAVVDFSLACEELLVDSTEFWEGRDGIAELAPDTTDKCMKEVEIEF